MFDATAGLATMMGPGSRELMRRVSPQEFSDDAQPYLSSRWVEVGRAEALCLRVSFVGELGYELYPSADVAVEVYDALVAAGRDLGYHAGYHALDSLRSEKGYRHLGDDIGPATTPGRPVWASPSAGGRSSPSSAATRRRPLATGPGLDGLCSSRCETRQACCWVTRPSCPTVDRWVG